MERRARPPVQIATDGWDERDARRSTFILQIQLTRSMPASILRWR